MPVTESILAKMSQRGRKKRRFDPDPNRTLGQLKTTLREKYNCTKLSKITKLEAAMLLQRLERQYNQYNDEQPAAPLPPPGDDDVPQPYSSAIGVKLDDDNDANE